MKFLKLKNILPWLIVLVGCTVTVLMIAFGEEEPMIISSVRPMAVETISAKKADYRIQVPAWGFIEPRESIDIRAEISGKIKAVPNKIFAGAEVKKHGDTLFVIDDRSYRNKLDEAVAAKKLAQQALEIEKGRQAIAQAEWEMLEKSKWQGNKNKSLALRKPQLSEREAAMQIASVNIAQARLDVERAYINAPCTGVIISENIAEGKILDTGDIAIRVGCTDYYHITAMFPPEYSIDPDYQKVIVNIGSVRYEGVIKAMIPQINSEIRHKQVLVEFKGNEVILGSYAMMVLPGFHFKNALVLPKKVLRSGNTVWILTGNNTLDIRTVKILAKDTDNAVIGEGITESDRVILTHIASPLSGMNLSMLSQQPESRQNIKHEGERNK
ncbi:MAG: hypothetical protein HQK72_16540 [Desulfamplus sp.]|nr:hypothetical protein [Desulfamplus sp.]